MEKMSRGPEHFFPPKKTYIRPIDTWKSAQYHIRKMQIKTVTM